jgi:hypothetical protein
MSPGLPPLRTGRSAPLAGSDAHQDARSAARGANCHRKGTSALYSGGGNRVGVFPVGGRL